MSVCDTLIRNALVIDGSGADSQAVDVAIDGDRICAVGQHLSYSASQVVDGEGMVLAPDLSMSIPMTIRM